ncbi:aminodeoxychorismate synthase component I [Saccharomonospora sp. CUA-673]|uniref:aminodeoxychorismate synthase component I n=1 Tax=Saccharomonospora sp. CUA-673 TaxID=1904969 RepID=UPI0009622302|nr:aminodeoxychorismate synthase component I [Saccharomonospora sp. CUA-673]OLT49288.1 aminodeoxychorismate synthase component I [Saccharomonospora sp. CUA-673]
MRLQRTALTSRLPAERVLTALEHRARTLGLPPPAALTGDWFRSRAVLAPSVRLEPVTDLDTALDLPDPTGRSEPTADTDAADTDAGAVGGGWFGYLSYDLADPSGRAGLLPRAVWGWADHVLRLDAAGRWWFESLRPHTGPEVDEFERLLTDPPPVPDTWRATSLHRPPADVHHKAVRECVHAIEAGELFQANICTRFTGRFDGAPVALFAEGVRRLNPMRAAYLSGAWGSAVSMSPELFVSRRDADVRSTPIKGTRPRTGDAGDTGAEQLRASVKDVAENVMITDLVRNDLGRVCAVGSVRVPELLAVRPAPGVWHLDSTVVGTLAPGNGDADLLRATFPPGSVTGAPKIRALDLIAELEGDARGLYTGAMGLVSPVAGLELNVAIRTFEIRDGIVEVGVGGGITADSDPAAEWRECLDKAAPLEQLLATPPRSARPSSARTGSVRPRRAP